MCYILKGLCVCGVGEIPVPMFRRGVEMFQCQNVGMEWSDPMDQVLCVGGIDPVAHL